jgi:predicted peptidase
MRIGLTSILSLLFSIAAMSTDAAEVDLRSKMEKKVFKNAEGETLPYRLLVPQAYDAQKKYPIVLFLHGAGERGNDNEAQLKHAQFLRLTSDPKHPCFVVAPQCPADDTWAGLRLAMPYRTEEATKPMRLVMQLLDALDKEYSIDPARRYVTGLSMGGFGSFDLCVRRPKEIAAAIPVCGGGDTAKAAELKNIAFWAIHGGADGVVPPDHSRKMVAALKEAGAKAKYTEFPGVGHDSWTKAYDVPGIVEWLFEKKAGR